MAQLSAVMPGQEAPPEGTPEHARLLELVASMRRLLAIFLAEHMTTMRELRKCAALPLPVLSWLVLSAQSSPELLKVCRCVSAARIQTCVFV